MADAYKLKADVSFPQAIRKVEDLAGGEEVFETVGRNYVAGSYVLASEMTPRDRERAEKGELDHVLEAASVEDAEQYRKEAGNEFGVYIPEHEAEAVVLLDYGHEIVPKDQVLELKSAGADAAREALEAAKSDGLDERPALKAAEVPSLADVSRGEAENVPSESEKVADEKLEGVEQPPGVNVGAVKEAAEGGEPKAAPRRKRPGKSGDQAAKDSQES